MLYNVLYVPDFQFSPISIPKLCFDLNVSITISANDCLVQGHTNKETVILGRLTHGLYYVDTFDHKALDNLDDSCMTATDSTNKPNSFILG